MDFALARQNMVEGQIRTNRVTDSFLLSAIEELPRESFVSGDLKNLAYMDEDIMVGKGRILMEPMVMARLLEAAHVEANDLCLVVGSATGYEAAVLAKLAGAVVAVDNNAALHKAATKILTELGCETVNLVSGAPEQGQPKQGPYDVIFINGAVAELPNTLTNQLAEGGRLVYVQAQAKGAGRATIVRKNFDDVSPSELFDANIPSMPEFEAKPEFNF